MKSKRKEKRNMNNACRAVNEWNIREKSEYEKAKEKHVEELKKRRLSKGEMANPEYYQGTITPMEFMESLGYGEAFCKGNAIKYIVRAGKKGDEKDDILKAIDYLNRRLYQIEKEEEKSALNAKE